MVPDETCLRWSLLASLWGASWRGRKDAWLGFCQKASFGWGQRCCRDWCPRKHQQAISTTDYVSVTGPGPCGEQCPSRTALKGEGQEWGPWPESSGKELIQQNHLRRLGTLHHHLRCERRKADRAPQDHRPDRTLHMVGGRERNDPNIVCTYE
jgi:hypothetical protein